MRAALASCLCIFAVLASLLPAHAEPCTDATDRISRVVEIDTATGPLFGSITKYQKEPSFLGPKEVVLTFDDGPMPWITRSILDTLDRFCVKATFFSVGRMAVAYPDTLREITNRGHTLGGHTWSHPLNLRRMNVAKALEEIERGFAATALANRDGVAPFFRFPGLSDSAPLLAALQKRGIATFTVDVVSDDSYIADPKRLTEVTLRRIEARQGGIILFHDIKSATAKALPGIIAELVRRGYSFVHMRAKSRLDVADTYTAELAPQIEKNLARALAGKTKLIPFYGTIGPERLAFVEATAHAAPVTQLTPPLRERIPVASKASSTGGKSAADGKRTGSVSAVGKGASPHPNQQAPGGAAGDGWATEVVPLR